MDSMKMLVIAMLLGALPACANAQATGAAQQVRKSAEQAAAQASGQAAKPAGTQAAPAKNATAAKPQPKPQGQAPAKAPAPSAKPGTPAAKPGVAPATKPATAAKPAAKNQTKPAKKTPAKKPAAKRPSKPVLQAANQPAPKAARRDPFEAMIGREQTTHIGNTILPPGIRGLQVSTLRLDGVVRAPNGMIAVVSNPQARTYFLREGDELYDGRVDKIAMDGVSFHEMGKDAFGKPVEREVSKRIYASAGEQQ